jgi:AraC-like DNA-binding protein
MNIHSNFPGRISLLRPDEYFDLFICGLCGVTALGLLLKPLNIRKILLAFILVFLAYVQVITVLISSRLIYLYPNLYLTSLPLGYALSPLVFLYIRSYMQERSPFRSVDLLHFIPVAPLSLIVLQYLSLPDTEKVQRIEGIYSGHSPLDAGICFNIGVFTIYTVLIILRLAKVYHRENPLHRLLVRVFILLLTWVLLLSARIFSIFHHVDILWRTVNGIISLELLLFYFILQRFPILLSFAHMSAKEREPRGKTILDSVDTEDLKKNIELIMDRDNLFCDEDLSLNRFSHALEISAHQLSAFLNEHYGKNFNAFINGYRIRYACNLFKSDPKMSTLSAAFASGFNSYSAFFTAFKKEIGLSPREYKNSGSGG